MILLQKEKKNKKQNKTTAISAALMLSSKRTEILNKIQSTHYRLSSILFNIFLYLFLYSTNKFRWHGFKRHQKHIIIITTLPKQTNAQWNESKFQIKSKNLLHSEWISWNIIFPDVSDFHFLFVFNLTKSWNGWLSIEYFFSYKSWYRISHRYTQVFNVRLWISYFSRNESHLIGGWGYYELEGRMILSKISHFIPTSWSISHQQNCKFLSESHL